MPLALRHSFCGAKIPIDKRPNILSRTNDLALYEQAAVNLASIPFRFKAGGSGNMAPVSAPQHHHRSTTKLNKKNFKSRHASKGALKELSKGIFDHPPPWISSQHYR